MDSKTRGLKPIHLEGETIESFQKRYPVERVVDNYAGLAEELFLIRNPNYRFNRDYRGHFEEFIKDHLGKDKSLSEAGSWFYFPWNKILIHYLPEELHQELRTARNRNLITEDEQKKFYDFKIGVTGLSVGSHAALTLAMMGAGRVMKLADPDSISGSNLNRVRYDFTEVGQNKCDLITRKIYQVNPYSEISMYPKGITPDNITEFLAGPPKLDILVEEADNLEMKIRLRLEAKKLGIPVVMATDNGDNVIVDIERYDLDPDLQPFNGVAGDLTLEEFQSFTPQELPRLATKIAGPGLLVPRMMESLLEVGKSLYSWPQLGSAATLSGVVIAYLVRRIANGEKVQTGKLEVNLDSIFDPDYRLNEAARAEENRIFLKQLGIPR